MRLHPALLLLTLALPAAALAQDTSALRREVFAHLDLTGDQKAKLHALHEANAPQDQVLAQKLHEAGHALATALASPDVTTDAALTKLHETFAQAREAMAAYRFRGILEIRKILTPEQRTKFAELYLAYRQKRSSGGQ